MECSVDLTHVCVRRTVFGVTDAITKQFAEVDGNG